MRNPTRDLAGNLLWTSDGICWATWRLSPLPYGRRARKDKEAVRSLHRLLIRSIPGEALLLGISIDVDPAAVVERMISGIDLETCPATWIEEAEATLEQLSDPALQLGQRAYYITVPLTDKGTKQWKASLKASWGELKEQVGMQHDHPSPIEVAARNVQAARIAASFPQVFNPTPISVAEQVWLAAHQQARGLQEIPPSLAEEFGQLVTHNGVALPEPILDAGARTDLEGRRPVNPYTRRVLKIQDPTAPDQPASYQSLLVMTSTPAGGVTFPGSELFARLDELGPSIDWAIRIKINSRDDVMRQNRRAVRELNDQYTQRSDDQGATFGSHDLEQAGKLLEEYQSLFAADQLEVEVEHTVLLAVGADTYEQADEEGNALMKILGGVDFKFDRPVGSMTELWWAFHPGVPIRPTVSAYRQYTSSDHFAGLVPFTTTKLGGDRGQVLALNRATARPDVVHVDLTGQARGDKSGAFACTGEQGGGKTYVMKTINGYIVAIGGQMFVIDKGTEGEWTYFAEALTDDCAIIDPTNPKWSMDPLRIHKNPDEASLIAGTFYTTLLGCAPRERMGLTLGQVLRPAYLAEHDLHGSGDLLQHLATDCTLEMAKELAEQMQIYAETIFGTLIFDQSLPAVDPTTTAIVWRTNKMDQPTNDEVSSAHQFDRLPVSKTFGRAYYRLIMSTAKQWAFADATRPACFNLDEAWDMFVNEENAIDAEAFVRQGSRRRLAFLVIGSHNPDKDFGSDTLRRLIPTRIVFRQTDDDLARASIRFLGVPEDDPEFEDMVKQLKEDTSPIDAKTQQVPPERRGECFIRDAFGGIGEGRVLGPALPRLLQAVKSTPSSSTKEPSA